MFMNCRRALAAFLFTATLLTGATASAADRTALQKHVDFFDRNNNGQITVSETYEGLRALGFSGWRSWGFAVAINAGLGRATGASWWSPLTVYTANIHKGKHDSDTDSYDTKGEFNQAEFDDIFVKYDEDGDDALTESEFEAFYRGNREDAASSTVSTFEFDLLMEIAGEWRYVDGGWTQALTRQKLIEFYDGSLFYVIAGEQVPF